MTKQSEKPFKLFERDPEIRAQARKLRYELILQCERNRVTIEQIDGWPYQRRTFDTEAIRYAVYTAIDADQWQIFRIALKGLTTKEKLFLLRNRLVNTNSSDVGHLEQVRVNNYIGALVRGGQLDHAGKVQR